MKKGNKSDDKWFQKQITAFIAVISIRLHLMSKQSKAVQTLKEERLKWFLVLKKNMQTRKTHYYCIFKT